MDQLAQLVSNVYHFETKPLATRHAQLLADRARWNEQIEEVCSGPYE
jgi:hypothetical protein